MNSENLDQMLRQSAAESIPECPKNLTEGIWREIRLRQGAKETGLLYCLAQLLLQPRLVSSALLLALLLGLSLGQFASNSLAQQRLAADSLHLEIFSGNAPELPSTLISSK